MILVALCACYLLFICPRTAGPTRIIMMAVVGAYLFHATLGVVFHKMVFYGRLLHMHIPFVVFGAAMAVVCIPWRRVRLATYGCVGIACAASFVTQVSPLWQLSYPRDFEQRQLAHLDAERLCIVDEINGPYDLEYDTCAAVAVNVTSFPFGIPDFFFPVRLDRPWTLASTAPHPRSHPAYRFEGSSVESRRNARVRGFEMRLYTRQASERLAGR